MVLRTSGGKVKSSSRYEEATSDIKIGNLMTYVDVKPELLRRLEKARNVDDVRNALNDYTPGFDIANILDYYPDTVMKLGALVIEDHGGLIKEFKPKMVFEPTVKVLKKRVRITKPKKIKVIKEGKVTYRYKATPWRKKGQKGMSREELFIHSRDGQPIAQIHEAYVEHFGIFRSRQSVATKLYRLRRR